MSSGFKKVLIANRGEIALRVIRACKELGIRTVAVYSEADHAALHVTFADQAVCIGPAPSLRSYLNVPAIVTAAEITGADAIHPGYGFLSESSTLAEVCEACGIAFIGPDSEAMRLMGDKSQARKAMARAGIPVLPGSAGVLRSEHEAARVAREIGFPVILKASAGGGGRGMRIVRSQADLACAFRIAQAEAARAFGRSDVYLEKYVEAPRHVEIQIMADRHGNIVHLGERECSIQRRHQKLLEETPSPALNEKLRREMGRAAVAVAGAVRYANAGTVEFLLDGEGRYYFMEMNTRIQVEHGVTELRIRHFHVPGGPGVRVDTAAYEGCEISPYYDSLVAKLMVHGRDRGEAIARMQRCLDEVVVDGIRTSVPLHREILRAPAFRAGCVDTGFLERRGVMDQGMRAVS